MPNAIQAGTLVASGQSGEVHGRKVDIGLSGTWVGTVALQVYMNGGWIATGDEWTANAVDVGEGATNMNWRLSWTRTSGSLVYELRAA